MFKILIIILACLCHVHCIQGIVSRNYIEYGKRCPKKYPVYVRSTQQCIKASRIKYPCMYSDQCKYYDGNAICNGLCECRSNYTTIEGRNKVTRCKIKAALGSQCDYSEQCETMTEHSWCDKGQCTCYFEKDTNNGCTDGSDSKSGSVPAWLVVSIVFVAFVLVVILTYDCIKKSKLCRCLCGKQTRDETESDDEYAVETSNSLFYVPSEHRLLSEDRNIEMTVVKKTTATDDDLSSN